MRLMHKGVDLTDGLIDVANSKEFRNEVQNEIDKGVIERMIKIARDSDHFETFIGSNDKLNSDMTDDEILEVLFSEKQN